MKWKFMEETTKERMELIFFERLEVDNPIHEDTF